MTYTDIETAVNHANGQAFTNIYQASPTAAEEFELYYEEQVIQKIIDDSDDVIGYVVKWQEEVGGNLVEFYEVVTTQLTDAGHELKTIGSNLWEYGTVVLTAVKEQAVAVGTAVYNSALEVTQETWDTWNNWYNYVGGTISKFIEDYVPCLYDFSTNTWYARGDFVEEVNDSVSALLEEEYSNPPEIPTSGYGQIAYFDTVKSNVHYGWWRNTGTSRDPNWVKVGSIDLAVYVTIIDLTDPCFMVYHWTRRNVKYKRYIFLSANKPCVIVNDCIKEYTGSSRVICEESGCILTYTNKIYYYSNGAWRLYSDEGAVNVSLNETDSCGGVRNIDPPNSSTTGITSTVSREGSEYSAVRNYYYASMPSNNFIPTYGTTHQAANTIYDLGHSSLSSPDEYWINGSGENTGAIKTRYNNDVRAIAFWLALDKVVERQRKTYWGHLGGLARNVDLPEPITLIKPDGTPDPWYPILMPDTVWDTDEPLADDTPETPDPDIVPPSITPIPSVIDRDPGPTPEPGGDPVIVTPGNGSVPVPPANEPNDDLGFCAIWRMTPAYLETFCQWLWSPNFIDQVLAYFTSPNDAIVGVHKIYWTPTYSTTMQEIRCGYLNSNCNGWPVTQRYNTINCGTVTLDETYGNIYDYTDTELIIYLPYIGFVPLDLSLCMRGTIGVKYVLDVVSGAGVCQISVTRDGLENHIASYGCSCASPIPISSGNYIAIVQSVATAAAQAIEGVGGLVNSKAFAEMNRLGKVGAGIGVGESTMNALDGAKTNVQLSGRFSSQVGDMDNKKPYLVIKRPNAVPAQTNYDFIGKPSRQVATLSTLSGFNQVVRIHPANVGNMTDDELSELEEIFASGVMM